MKILQVNCVYKKGSTGKIVHDIHRGLQEQGIESIVCYGRGQKENEPNAYKTSSEILAKFNALRSRITGLQYNGSFIATNKLIRIIKNEKPDIVHLHCINGFFVNIYSLLDFLKNNNIKTVVTLHAEFMHTGNCGHAYDCEKWKTGCGNCPQLWEATHSYIMDRTHTAWKKMRAAFEGFDDIIVTSVSPWLAERAKQSPILYGKKNAVVLNGIETKEIFYPREYEFLKKRYGLKVEKILLHVTADFTSEIKGGKYIIELARRLAKENIKIIVIGNRETDMKLPPNIIDVGRVNDQRELAAYYSMADLLVLTSKRETFSMVCVESLSCGTPVVGFKAGAPEQISLEEYSEFVEYGDMDALEEAVNRWLGKKYNLQKNITQTSKELYSKERMCEEYQKLYENIFYGLNGRVTI